ncbi:MAG: type II toxin-antitoxin system VapC family toxin [Cyanobacteriota bacterium]|nr:type II toxin-antitoxin system VapC family toxin [Cyanobacteriota bacterium]
MIYLLDSNVCIVYLKAKNEKLKRRLEALSSADIAVCSVTKSELFSGANKSNNPQRGIETQKKFFSQFVSLTFDDNAAEFYAEARSKLESLGTPIGSYDLQIAAIALANNLILVTHNVREFSRVEGLCCIKVYSCRTCSEWRSRAEQ